MYVCSIYVRVYIRCHACDVYLEMCPIKMATPTYLNVLAHFDECSQTAAVKNN